MPLSFLLSTGVENPSRNLIIRIKKVKQKNKKLKKIKWLKKKKEYPATEKKLRRDSEEEEPGKNIKKEGGLNPLKSSL